jgi:hypothetical protein
MKLLLLTCDTEVGELASGEDAFEIFMEGKVNNQVAGVSLINSIASQYKVAVEHFMDIYPYERYSEKKFQKLCDDILAGGHFLQLHTHPSGRFDHSRKYMHQYTLDEQRNIVGWGKQKIHQWTGYEVIAHRAGGYGANEQTLTALKENGIGLDSSFFFQNAVCRIAYPHKNKCDHYNGIFEIPVTVYECEKQFVPVRKKIKYYAKLDFRYGSSISDIVTVVRSAPDNTIITLFLHSFNFLNLRYNTRSKTYRKITVNNHLIANYEKLLSELSQIPSAKFTSFREVNSAVATNEIDICIRKQELNGKSMIGKLIRGLSATIDV